MYAIKDPIHSYIKLTDLERSFLDCPEVQRLRGIKQLALTNLVYPGANHTRFEHSLGTVHLTGEMCDRLSLEPTLTKELRIAALLHDVGHGAFSHESDYFLSKYLDETHESIAAQKLSSDSIAGLLEREGLQHSRIASLVNGKGAGILITSGIGSDRMDYLLRDSHYTGVAYGVIDPERLIQTISLRKGTIVLDEGGLESAESLLIARFMMFSTVYTHHAVRIASAMLKRAIQQGIDSSTIRPVDLLSLDDSGVMSRLAGDTKACHLIRMIENRNLFKRALVLDWHSFPPQARRRFMKDECCVELSQRIASSAGVLQDDVLVILPSPLSKDVDDVFLLSADKVVPLSSDIIMSIKASEEKRLRLIIACPARLIKRVGKAARRELSTYQPS
ncbi:MAG: HD domain-containing protein [Candidatus Micrarchaeota archaeon]